MKVLSLNRFYHCDNNSRALQYSFLKLGQGKAIAEYALELTKWVSQEVPTLVTAPSNWVIVYPGTGDYSIPNAITHVAGAVGKELEVTCVGLGKKDIASDDYAGRSKSERMKSRCINLKPEDRQRIINKNFILVDDSIATGTAIEKSADLLRHCGNLATCVVLADFRSAQDPRFERSLNRQVIQTGGMEVYSALLNNPKNYITSKLICYFSEDRPQLIDAFGDFEPLSIVNLVLGTIVYHKDNAPSHLSHIRKNIIDRHSQRNDDMLRNLVILIEKYLSNNRGNMSAMIHHIFVALSKNSRFRLDESQFDQVFDDLFRVDIETPKLPSR